MQPYAISVDWLQVYCFTDTYELENFVPIFPTDYKIIKMSYGTRQFKNVYEVYCDEREPNVTSCWVEITRRLGGCLLTVSQQKQVRRSVKRSPSLFTV